MPDNIEELKKECYTCKQKKAVSDFYDSKPTRCKKCIANKGVDYRNKNKDKIKERGIKYRAKNRERINKKVSEYQKNIQ